MECDHKQHYSSSRGQLQQHVMLRQREKRAEWFGFALGLCGT